MMTVLDTPEARSTIYGINVGITSYTHMNKINCMSYLCQESRKLTALEETYTKETYIKEYPCAVVTKEFSDLLKHSHKFLGVLLLAL